MIIEIQIPKPLRKFFFAWATAKAAFKNAFKNYDRRYWSKGLSDAEVQALFDDMYRKHMTTAKDKMRDFKDRGYLPTIGKPVLKTYVDHRPAGVI